MNRSGWWLGPAASTFALALSLYEFLNVDVHFFWVLMFCVIGFAFSWGVVIYRARK